MLPNIVQLEITLVVLGFTIVLDLAAVAVSLAISVALGALEQVLFKKKGQRPATPLERRQLNELAAAPNFVAAPGSIRIGRFITERRVKGRTLYLQLLVQSRPSAGPWTLWLDDKEIPLTGDALDFAGAGALSHDPDPVTWPHAALYAGHVRAWFGLGSQATVPNDLLAENPGLATAPIWPGFSVAWLAIAFGPDADARDRWPSGQPRVAVEGPMALLWDPRDAAQDRDDPATWAWSDNQALAVLDMVRHVNCLAAPDAVNVASFIAGADIADELVAIKGGGVEKRYRVGGSWEADGAAPFEMLEPALLAGMSQLTEIDGEWHFVAGRYLAPEVTWSESVLKGPAVSFIDERDPGEMFNTVSINYPEPARNWETQLLGDLTDAAALAADGAIASVVSMRLDWVPFAGQAFRIGWRSVQLTRLERELSGHFGSEAIQAHYGARIAIDVATVWGAVVEFRCEAWSIVIEEVDRDLGIARLIVAMTLRETGPGVDLYDPEAQPELAAMIGETAPDPVVAPAIVSVMAETTETASATVINARVTCEQSATASAVSYQTRYRQDLGGGSYGPYSQAAEVLADDLGPGAQFSVLFGPLELGNYEVQVRTNSSRGLSSYAIQAFTIASPTTAPAAPTLVAGATGTDHVVTWGAPNDPRHARLVFWTGNPFASAVETDSVGTFPLAEVVNTGSGASGVDVYYWATSRDVWGNDSLPAGPAVHQTQGGP